jgi:hypothetical protein
MRLPLLLTALLAAAPADDAALTHYDLVPSDVRDALFIDVTTGDFWVPPPTPSLRALDPAGRVAAVKIFAQFAKAYTSSSDFQTRYSKWRAHELGEAPKKPPTYEEWVKAQKQQAKAANQQLDDQMKSASPEQQEQMRQMQKQLDSMAASLTPEQRAQMQAQMQALLGKQVDLSGAGTGGGETAPTVNVQTDKQVYQELVVDPYKKDLAAYQEKLAKSPEKASAAVKLALKQFLANTADVNFDAKLVDAGPHQAFADANLEAKPDVWKRAFRAGKEATAAARQAAQSWVAELK